MRHICVGNLTIIGSDNGLSPGRCHAIIWTNDGILIRPVGTNFSEILIEIHALSFRKMYLKAVVWIMAAILSRPQCVKTRWTTLVKQARGGRLDYRMDGVILDKNQKGHFDSLVQDCSISSALAMEILQSCNKPSICNFCVTDTFIFML